MQESAQWQLLRQPVQWGANQPFMALVPAPFLVWVRLKSAPAGLQVELVERARIGRNSDMKLGNEMRKSAALVWAAALAGAGLVVHAECGILGPSGNDAEVACHNCANDTWSTGSCTWHEAEVGDAYCGVCSPGYLNPCTLFSLAFSFDCPALEVSNRVIVMAPQTSTAASGKTASIPDRASHARGAGIRPERTTLWVHSFSRRDGVKWQS
jgi:hypothetical protein